MSKEIKAGKAWVVYSEKNTTGELELISLLQPRKSIEDIASYVEQAFVDRFASIYEKVA